MPKNARSLARFSQPPFPLNGFQLCLAFFSTAPNLRSAVPLITASGDYEVREKVAELAEHVAGPQDSKSVQAIVVVVALDL